VQRETCTNIKTTILWAAWSSRLKAWTAMHNELVMYVYAVNQNSLRLMILKICLCTSWCRFLQNKIWLTKLFKKFTNQHFQQNAFMNKTFQNKWIIAIF
jgi:hypothetical protein